MSKNIVQLNVKLNVKPAELNAQIDTLSSKLKALKLSATLDLSESTKVVNARIDKLSNSVKKLQLIGSINVAKTKENIHREVKKLGENLTVNTKIKVDSKQAKQEIDKVNGSSVKSKSLEFDISQFQRKMAIVQKTLSDSKSHKVDSKSMSDLMTRINELSTRTPNAQREIKNLNMEMKELASSSKHVESSMGTAIKGMFMWSAAATAFYAPIRAVQSMTSEILELDKQMTNLKRVMDLPSYEYSNMLERTMQMSNELGVSVKNSLEVMEGFAKQGYKGTDLDSLTRTTELLQTLSDLTPEQSVATLTSAMANYNITARESITIGDKLNEIDNNYSITTLDLATALRKNASASEAFGVSMNRNLGNITAITSATKESGAIVGYDTFTRKLLLVG